MKHLFSPQRHKKSSVRQQVRGRKADHSAARQKKQEAAGRAQKQRKKHHQLLDNPSIPPSSTEQQLPPSVNFLEESSDDEDKPTDYELLLSTFKPLAKKPRLMGDERGKKKDTIRSISGGGDQDFCATVHEGGRGGGGVVGEKEGERLGDFVADEGNCSDHGGADDDDAAGKGNDTIVHTSHY